MMLYVLICLSLSLAGVAGLQFFYLIYLEALDKDKKKRIYDLEKHCKSLSNRLQTAEMKLAERDELINSIYEEEIAEEEEVWADVIEDA